MPFSAGQRDCIGQNLARMNYVTTVAMLLARFSLKLAIPVSRHPSSKQPKVGHGTADSIVIVMVLMVYLLRA